MYGRKRWCWLMVPEGESTTLDGQDDGSGRPELEVERSVQCQMQSRVNKLKVGWGYELSKGKPPPLKGLPASPSSANWGPRVHVWKPMGNIFLSKHEAVPCYIWNIIMQQCLVCLKFKCNWTSHVLSRNPTGMSSKTLYKINHLDTRDGVSVAEPWKSLITEERKGREHLQTLAACIHKLSTW